MQRYAGLGSERYCWREGSVIDDLRYVHGFGIERNSSVRGVQIQSIRQRSRALTFRFSWGGEFGGGPASAGPPPKFPEPSVVMFPTFYGHSRTLSSQTYLFDSQNSRQRRTIASSVQAKPASQKCRSVNDKVDFEPARNCKDDCDCAAASLQKVSPPYPVRRDPQTRQQCHTGSPTAACHSTLSPDCLHHAPLGAAHPQRAFISPAGASGTVLT